MYYGSQDQQTNNGLQIYLSKAFRVKSIDLSKMFLRLYLSVDEKLLNNCVVDFLMILELIFTHTVYNNLKLLYSVYIILSTRCRNFKLSHVLEDDE